MATPSQNAVDTHVAAEAHTAYLGPVASIQALCKEVNDDLAKSVCTPGATRALAGSPVLEIGVYTVQMPEAASRAYLAVRTSKGWFVPQRKFVDDVFGRVSHHTPTSESIALDRARQTSDGVFVVHVRDVRTYLPGMGPMGHTETTTESMIHCRVDAQGTPTCTAPVEVTSRVSRA